MTLRTDLSASTLVLPSWRREAFQFPLARLMVTNRQLSWCAAARRGYPHRGGVLTNIESAAQVAFRPK